MTSQKSEGKPDEENHGQNLYSPNYKASSQYELSEAGITHKGEGKYVFSLEGIKIITVSLKDKTANAGPLGLLGFGLTTFLLNLHNAGVFELSPIVLAMGLCYGGFAQLLGGIFEWIKGRMFTAVVFISYGTFWWSFVFIFAIPSFGWTNPVDDMSLACYLFIWGVLTTALLVASFKKPIVVRLIFITLVILFYLLAAGKWSGSKNTITAAGVIGIICGLLAAYAGCAEVINEAYDRTILPLGADGEKCCGKE